MQKACFVKCKKCDLKFVSKAELKSHNKVIHSGGEKWLISKENAHPVETIWRMCNQIVQDVVENIVYFRTHTSELKPKIVAGKSKNSEENSSDLVGVWVPDLSLPAGWKTCVLRNQIGSNSSTPEKRMFYSPCGKLFSSRRSLETFFDNQKKDEKLKMNQSLRSPPELRPEDVCKPKLEPNSSETNDSSDAISLSDDDLLEENEKSNNKQYRKRKRESFGCKDQERKKKRKIASYNDKALKFDLYPSEKQERILIACYDEWPIPFVDLVDQLVLETGLKATLIKEWFNNRTQENVRRLFSSV